MPTINRRRLLSLTATAGVSAGALAALANLPDARAASGVAAVEGFPTFTHLGQPLDLDSLRYNPTGEFIFPCIRRVEGRVADPLGAWYLYYAPHDPPGGICLAYGDSLEGPFTEYEGNPVISRTWAPHYDVSHVSSPHAYWNAADGRIYLYFHGENTTTRVATSSDGVNFTYGGAVMSTAQLPADVTEASYARVFDHPARDGIYIMLFMGNQAGTRKIFIAWSHSLTSGWTAKPEALISPGAGEGGQLSSPHYWSRNGGGHVVYHSGAGTIHVADVGVDFDRENHLGVLHEPLPGPPDNGRSAAPSFAVEGDQLYMFYEAGARLDATIAVASAPI